MFVAALILLLLAVLAIIAAVFGGTGATTVDLGSFNVTTSATAVFFAGMVTLLLLVLSLGLIRAGIRRASARRADRRRVSELSTKLDEYKREEREHTEDRDHD